MVNSKLFNFLKPYKLMVSPKVSGEILMHGEPIKNIEVTLLAGFNEYYEKKVITDKEGKFTFEPIFHRQWMKPLSLNENLIGIQITAKVNSDKVLLWSSHTGLVLHDYVVINLEKLEYELGDATYEYHFKNRVVSNGRNHLVFGACRLKGYEEKLLREDL